MYDDNGNGRISISFAETHANGIALVHRGHPAYDHLWHADGDGVVCE